MDTDKDRSPGEHHPRDQHDSVPGERREKTSPLPDDDREDSDADDVPVSGHRNPEEDDNPPV
jgi:hypothetical protein